MKTTINQQRRRGAGRLTSTAVLITGLAAVLPSTVSADENPPEQPAPTVADIGMSLGSDSLVSASSSVCVAVPGANSGDVAVVNITNTDAAGSGFGSLRSSDATPVYDRSASEQYSSVNFAANTPANPNLAFATVGSDGQFCYDGAVSTHNVILDLAGVIPGANIDAGDPTRLLDTRTTGRVSASSSVCVAVPGANSGDVAVVNITNTDAAGSGFGSLRSSDATPVYDRSASEQYSSVNFAANTPANPNLAFATVGSDGQFCYDGAVSTHNVILDLAGVIPGANIDAGDPTRLLDTRTTGRVSASSSVCVAVPGANSGDVAVVNITNTDAAGSGFGSLRSSDATPVYDRSASEQYSSVNFAANTPANPNLAFATVGSDGQFCYDGAVSTHNVILDLAGVIPGANIDAGDPTRLLDTRQGTPPPTTPTTPPSSPTGPPSGPPGIPNVPIGPGGGTLQEAASENFVIGWNLIDADGRGGFNDWFWDGNGNGRPEVVYINTDFDGDYDIVIYDQDENGVLEWANVTTDGDAYREMWIYQGRFAYFYLDLNHDGAWEVHGFDGEKDGYWEWVALDFDRNGHADRWIANNQVPAYQDAGSVAARDFARSQAQVAAVGVLFDATATAAGYF